MQRVSGSSPATLQPHFPGASRSRPSAHSPTQPSAPSAGAARLGGAPTPQQPTAAPRLQRHRQRSLHCRAAVPEAATATKVTPDTAATSDAEAVARRARMHAAIPAGPRDDPPSYEAIDAAPHNRLFMHLFREAVVDGLGEDTPAQG